jgi:hypothetical protein
MLLTLSSAAPTVWSMRFVRWWRSYGCGVVGCGAVTCVQAWWNNGDGDGDLVLHAERTRGKARRIEGDGQRRGTLEALMT